MAVQSDADCPGCTAAKTSIPEESRQRALQWRGCRFVPAAKPEEGDRFTRQRQVADLFSANAPVPQARTDHFQWVLSNERFRCVGWYGTVAKVVDGPEGTVVELVARPHLFTREGGIAHTPAASRETWRVDGRNNLVCEKIEAEPGHPKLLMTD